VPAIARTRGPHRRWRRRSSCRYYFAPPARPSLTSLSARFRLVFYLTAFGIAINRIELKEDPKAMTPSGELYTGGLGVPQNDGNASEWYKLAD
jgi:hypothetical protein